MSFPPAFLDEIRNRVSLPGLIGRRVRLVRKGREFMGLCPFHNEKTPSFTVNDDKGFFHCLAAETRVITEHGNKPIADLAGKTATILTRGGVWREATFRAFGRQRLHRIELSRNGVKKSLYATSGHRWFVRGRISALTTAELRPGHRLQSVFPSRRGNWALDPDGVRHGIVYGDGSLQRKGQARYGTVNLHGEKADDLGQWFADYEPSTRARDDQHDYLRVYGGRGFAHMKSMPEDNATDEYLLGFLAGYLATDGHVAKDGTVMLHSVEREALEWIRDTATKLGIGTFSITNQKRQGYLDHEETIYRIHFVTSSLAPEFFIREGARRRFAGASKRFDRLRWTVVSVTESDRVEEVFCAEVPVEHAFALEDNILTGNCFGCGAHGDVIAFAMRAEHLSFPEAIEKLAAEAGLEVPQQAPEEREKARRQASLLDAAEAACAFYERSLREPAGRAGLAYLHGRGLDDETIARFRLGFAPEPRGSLRRALEAAGIPMPLAAEAGLLTIPEGGGEPFDRFHGRVMFPISDRRGRVVAFGGRILGDGQPKYLNSPDSALFHKGAMLYGLAQAREAAIAAGTIIVCEGYMDVIALSRAGFGHAVAPLGTALTEEQIELLWRSAAEPIICLDGDAAGQRAALRAAERALPLLKPGLSLRFALLPTPEDPDSLIRKSGAEAMRGVLDRAEPLSAILWANHVAGRPTDTPERRAAFERDLMLLVDRILDQRVRDEYRRDFRGRLRAHFATSWRRPPRGRDERPFGGVARRFDRGPDGRLPGVGLPMPLAEGRHRHERMLLLPLLATPALLDEVAERLGELHFSDAGLDALRQYLVSAQNALHGLDSRAAQDYLRASGFAQVLDSLLAANTHESWAFDRTVEGTGKARAVWEDALRLYLLIDLAADISEAEQRYAKDPSAENYAMLEALRKAEIQRMHEV